MWVDPGGAPGWVATAPRGRLALGLRDGMKCHSLHRRGTRLWFDGFRVYLEPPHPGRLGTLSMACCCPANFAQSALPDLPGVGLQSTVVLLCDGGRGCPWWPSRATPDGLHPKTNSLPCWRVVTPTQARLGGFTGRPPLPGDVCYCAAAHALSSLVSPPPGHVPIDASYDTGPSPPCEHQPSLLSTYCRRVHSTPRPPQHPGRGGPACQ
jgi:hypothetical protein